MFRQRPSFMGIGLTTLLGLMGLVAINGKDSAEVLNPVVDAVTQQLDELAHAHSNADSAERGSVATAPSSPTASSTLPVSTASASSAPVSTSSYTPRSTATVSTSRSVSPSQDGIEVYFSPKGGCTAAIVRELNAARKIILVQAYSFTSEPIAAAVADAQERGVRVHAILDKSQLTEKYSSADFLAHAGVETSIDDRHAIAHNKIMLIDGETIITGSFNFTKSAENSNAENLLIIRDRPDLYKLYEDNFRHHYEHSRSFSGRDKEPPVAGRSRTRQ